MPPKYGGAVKCAKCGKSVYGNEGTKAGTGVYHLLTCFKCEVCQKKATGVFDGQLRCLRHSKSHEQQGLTAPLSREDAAQRASSAPGRGAAVTAPPSRVLAASTPAAAKPSVDRKKCPKCGAQALKKFCAQCGHQLEVPAPHAKGKFKSVAPPPARKKITDRWNPGGKSPADDKKEEEKAKAQKEKAEKEKAEKEKAEKEKAEKEKAEKEKAEKEKAEKEKAGKEKAEKEKAEKKREEKEKKENEKKEKEAKEKAEKEKAQLLARKEKDKERAATIKADREQAAKEKAEKEKADKQAEKEKAEKEKAEEEKAEKEKAEKEKAEKEKAEKEKAEQEKAEQEKAEKEQAEKEAEKEKAEKEKAEKEKAEKEKEREQAEREQAEKAEQEKKGDAEQHVGAEDQYAGPNTEPAYTDVEGNAYGGDDQGEYADYEEAEYAEQGRVLPPGWEEAYTEDDELYYFDTNTNTTHWELPQEVDEGVDDDDDDDDEWGAEPAGSDTTAAGNEDESVSQDPGGSNKGGRFGGFKKRASTMLSKNKRRSVSAQPKDESVASLGAVAMKGVLMKKNSGSSGAWRKRYFALLGPVLYYYQGPLDAKPSGKLVLMGREVGRFRFSNARPHGIYIQQTNTRTYWLTADTQELQDAWIAALIAEAQCTKAILPCEAEPVDLTEKRNARMSKLGATIKGKVNKKQDVALPKEEAPHKDYASMDPEQQEAELVCLREDLTKEHTTKIAMTHLLATYEDKSPARAPISHQISDADGKIASLERTIKEILSLVGRPDEAVLAPDEAPHLVLSSPSALYTYYEAAYDFLAAEEGQVSFVAGDIIAVTNTEDTEWFDGYLNDVFGAFPSTYLELMIPQPEDQNSSEVPNEAVEEGSILYDYEARTEEELSVHEGDIVAIVERGEDDWCTVSLRGACGLVPLTYIQLH